MHKKWIFFCERFARNSADPSQADVNAFICWMSTVGGWAQDHADGCGVPMAYQSIKDYIEHLGRVLRSLQKGPGAGLRPVITDSLQTHWALQSIKRILGDTKQRARALTMEELRSACANVRGDEGFVLAFRVIALTAWFGAFRLGQLLPHNNNKKMDTMRLSDMVQSGDGAVLVTSRRSKTNVFRSRTRTIRIGGSKSSPELCLSSALAALATFRRRHNLPQDAALSELHAGLATFEKFVKSIQSLIPRKQDVPLEKGRVTGHSFRRGFTKAALLAGYKLHEIMVHGDWNHEESVLNSYAVGAVLPSISLAPGAATRRGVSAAVVHEKDNTTNLLHREVARAPRAVAVFSRNNPYAPTDDCDPVLHARLVLRAKKWEVDCGPLSRDNPFARVGALKPLTDARREKRAREWEQAKSQFL